MEECEAERVEGRDNQQSEPLAEVPEDVRREARMKRKAELKAQLKELEAMDAGRGGGGREGAQGAGA